MTKMKCAFCHREIKNTDCWRMTCDRRVCSQNCSIRRYYLILKHDKDMVNYELWDKLDLFAMNLPVDEKRSSWSTYICNYQ